MQEPSTVSDRRERLPTRIAGLDRVLGGGLWRGSVYVIEGAPGTGKTILANQICANVTRVGGRAIYVSMLAESFTVMLGHLALMSFFEPSQVGDGIRYISGFNALEEGGFTGLLGLLRSETHRAGADVVVLDTLVPVHDATPNELQFKRRLLDLQALGSLAGFVTLLLTNEVRDARTGVVQQMADGVIVLGDETVGVRSDRTLVVTKFRGGESLRGRHSFRIDSEGLQVFPRLEATARGGPETARSTERMSSGVRKLDDMLGGGLPCGTLTGVIGGPGCGKTTLALQFMANASPGHPGVLFGFNETPESLRQSARTLGVDMPGLESSGALRVVWQPQGEQLLDELAHRLLETIDDAGAKRVVIDGYEAFVEAAVHTDRMTRFMTALSLELRRRSVTAYVTHERSEILGLGIRRPIHGSSPIFDNLIVVRNIEERGRLVRLLSVAKLRGSHFDPAVYEFDITHHGIRVGRAWTSGRELFVHPE